MLAVAVITPRAMHFGELRASSIDLCVRDLVRFSQFKTSTTVIGDAVEVPFPEISFRARPMGRPDSFHFRTPRLLRLLVRELKPDVVCVHEHLRTATYLAKRLSAPVLLQQHNPVRKPKGPLDRLTTTNNYNRLGGLMFVSDAQGRDFEQQWPAVRTAQLVVPNGLDTSSWHPADKRAKTVLVVGRARPEKGIKEAALALADVLPRHPDWKTIFILNEVESRSEYFAEVQAVLAQLNEQATVLVQRPFHEVKAQMETAAITLVPSIWNEPFGRVALEAHAGGSAVISSGTGGLRQVSSDTALYLESVRPDCIAEAVERLICNDATRSELALQGRHRAVQTFDIRKTAALCDEFYLSALRSR